MPAILDFAARLGGFRTRPTERRTAHPGYESCAAAAPPRTVVNSRRSSDHLIGEGRDSRRDFDTSRGSL